VDVGQNLEAKLLLDANLKPTIPFSQSGGRREAGALDRLALSKLALKM